MNRPGDTIDPKNPMDRMLDRTSWWLKAIPAGALGVATFTICSSTTNAFFPPIKTVTKVESVEVPPVSPPPPAVVPPVIPPVPPPPFVPPPPPPAVPPPPVVVPPVPPVPVHTTPEPAAIVSASLGLAIVTGWRMRRKKS